MHENKTVYIYYFVDIYQETTRFWDLANTKKRIIGQSAFGRNLYAVKMGAGSPVGIVQYAMHGREFITAKLAFAQYKQGVLKGSVWLIPLVNPDGALLSQTGLLSAPLAFRKMLSKINGKENFSLWKANGRGVDLNVNFGAKWGQGEKNVRAPASENYIGPTPFSEPESLALKKFTLEIRPDYTVSYHTKGEEIYWHFHQSAHTYLRDKRLGEILSASTGYPLAYAKGSVGGYKDWCIQNLKIPAFTIEAGADFLSHPIGDEGLENILYHNQNAIKDLSQAVCFLQQEN